LLVFYHFLICFYHLGASSLNSSPSFFLGLGAGAEVAPFSLIITVLPPPAACCCVCELVMLITGAACTGAGN
jgi:hypothetical protein